MQSTKNNAFNVIYKKILQLSTKQTNYFKLLKEYLIIIIPILITILHFLIKMFKDYAITNFYKKHFIPNYLIDTDFNNNYSIIAQIVLLFSFIVLWLFYYISTKTIHSYLKKYNNLITTILSNIIIFFSVLIIVIIAVVIYYFIIFKIIKFNTIPILSILLVLNVIFISILVCYIKTTSMLMKKDAFSIALKIVKNTLIMKCVKIFIIITIIYLITIILFQQKIVTHFSQFLNQEVFASFLGICLLIFVLNKFLHIITHKSIYIDFLYDSSTNSYYQYEKYVLDQLGIAGTIVKTKKITKSEDYIMINQKTKKITLKIKSKINLDDYEYHISKTVKIIIRTTHSPSSFTNNDSEKYIFQFLIVFMMLLISIFFMILFDTAYKLYEPGYSILEYKNEKYIHIHLYKNNHILQKIHSFNDENICIQDKSFILVPIDNENILNNTIISHTKNEILYQDCPISK